MRDPRPARPAILAALALALLGADEPGPAPVLRLANGGHAPGTLAESAGPGVIRWRSPDFASPLAFGLQSVNAIQWPPPAAYPEPAGDYLAELAGGDVVFGGLVALDERLVVLETARLGRLAIDRANVHRLYRRDKDGGIVYSGPSGLDGWGSRAPKDSWREEAGQPYSTVAGALMTADLGLPGRAVVDVEISWKGKPDFVLSLGVPGRPPEVAKPADPGPVVPGGRRIMRAVVAEPAGARRDLAKQAFRVEVWEGQLVVDRELHDAADVAPLGPAAEGSGRVQLRIYLDQPAGHLLVAAADGSPLADLTVVPRDGTRPEVLGGVSLANLGGTTRLERLRIGRWDGKPPMAGAADQPRVVRADGNIAAGAVDRYDATAREFVLKVDDGEVRVPADQAADVTLSAPRDEPIRAIRAVYADGTRVSGDLERVEAGAIVVRVPGVEGPTRLPVAGLRSVVVPGPVAAEPSKEGAGTLELAGLSLPGHLEAGPGLRWRADGAEAAEALRPSASGRIVYREAKPATATAAAAPPIEPRAAQGIKLFAAALGVGSKKPKAAATPERRALHLRTGDVIPCEVTSIDEAGVRFTTPLSSQTFVPHDKVKAVELAGLEPGFLRLTKSKRERLLTLPRMQRDSPPTQLLRSTNGDYLRGRVASMDAGTLQVESRLESKSIPRDRVARIIWLHADELDPPKAGPEGGAGADAGGAVRAQAVRADGIRLTFRPEAVEGATISGRSDVLGPCQVALAEVDQLLIGGAIDRAAAGLTYGRWTLHKAVEPKFAAGGAIASGTDSPLIGQPAPDFTLDRLEGTPFHLAASQGKEVVVLDFWATWCGPCMQSMPAVEGVAGEFKDKGVRLVAVNLQEAPATIKAVLQRQKLGVDVALDRDGGVADKYGATAIPQTVIVDREGRVARLFVGGGPELAANLRAALEEVRKAPDAGMKK